MLRRMFLSETRTHSYEVKHSFKQVVRDDGLVDSVTGHLCNYNDNKKILLNMLLRSF